MKNLNVNIEALKDLASKKLKISKKTFVVISMSMILSSVIGCGKTNKTEVESSRKPSVITEFQTEEETKVVEETTKEVVEEKITKLTVADFNKLVDEIEKENEKVDFSLRREYLELAVYLNNIEIATPELVEKIESYYNYNEEDMINVYLKTMTAYSNDKLDYYNGKDDKYADPSLTFTDKIDKETMQEVDATFSNLYDITVNKKDLEMDKNVLDAMVSNLKIESSYVGLELTDEEIKSLIYEYNDSIMTSEVKSEFENIKINKEELDSLAFYVSKHNFYNIPTIGIDEFKILVYNNLYDMLTDDAKEYVQEMIKRIGPEMYNIYCSNSYHEITINEVKKLIVNVRYNSMKTIDKVKKFNEESKEEFNLSNFHFEQYFIGNVVENMKDYTTKTGKIAGYTKNNLTPGGLFTVKMAIDDSFAYFATTGYANGYKEDIAYIEEANLEAVVVRAFDALGSARSMTECKDKQYVK